MASIEIWTRDVQGAPYIPGKGVPQHTFYIKVNNDGTKEIIRGGPDNGNMLTGDNLIIRQEYNGPTQSDGLTETQDWYDSSSGENPLNFRGQEVESGSQSEIDAIWEQGWDRAEQINDLDPDYEIYKQNSNASMSEVGNAMGTKDDSESFLDAIGAWVPGWGGTFENGPIDTAVDWISDKWDAFKKWIFGADSDDDTASQTEVLDSVDGNTGTGVGDGIDPINVEVPPSIISMVGDIASNVVGLVGGVINSVLSGITNVVSNIGSAIGGFFSFIGGLFGISGGVSPPSAGDASGGIAVPVVVDLDGDGVELSHLKDSSIFFDIDGDGYLEKTAWAGEDDGFLVIDIFQDGSIDFGEEMNFTLWDDTATTDMQALRNVFDTNQNGLLDVGDDRFDEFKIWRDANQNGIVDDGELKTLEERGLTAINIDSRVPVDENDGTVINGNIVYDSTDITWTGNQAGQAYDVGLEYSIGGIKFDGNSEEFSINYEDGREVKVYQAQEGAPINIDAASNNYDVIVGTSGNDTITNSGTEDVIFDGGAGDDYLEGGDGDDWLYGGAGSDTLHGGAGNDLLFIDSEDNLVNIDGGDGEDIAIMTSTNGVSLNITDYNIEKVFGNSGDDNFTSSGSTDVKMVGGAGNDILTGADGDDHLEGGIGDDILNGKGGNNFLTGGLGNDTYIIEINPGTTTEIYGFETRNDLEKIDISAFDLTELVIVTNNETTTIHLGNDQYINLTNTNVSAINANNFVFKPGTPPVITKHVQGSSEGEIIKGSNIDDVIDAGGGSNYIVTGQGDDIVYTNPDALDVIKISRKAGHTDTIYGFNTYNLTQLTYWMGDFTGDTTTGVGSITPGTPELWEEQTTQSGFNNTKFDFSEFGHIQSINDLNIYTQGSDTVIELDFGQKIILKDYIQETITQDYLYGRDWVGIGGSTGAQFIVDYDVSQAAINSSNFIFSNDGSITGSLIDDFLEGSNFLDKINGDDGNDTIYGYDGTDLLTGGRGDDKIYGGGNNDGIAGNEGDDEIHGGTGNDAMWGNDGNDTIYGEEGQDFLIGGTGSDTLYGGDDEDTYIFSIGDGRDTIIDTGINNGSDVLKFTEEITREMLSITRDGNDLIITFVGNVSDRITVKDQFIGNGIETLRFADNTEEALNSFGLEIVGTDGDDVLTGSDRDDSIQGGLGNDTLYGGEGNDTYIFNVGDGMDVIDESGSYSNFDVIQLGEDILFADVSALKVDNDLIVSFAGNPGDQITVLNHYNGDNSRIEKILFYDGSEIDLVDAAVNINGSAGNNVISGTIYNDNIYGGDGDDILEGKEGADFLDGGNGDDIISYRSSSSAVNVNLSTGAASGGDAAGDTFTNIEGIEGSAFDDTLTGSSIGNRIYGRDGDDYIDGKGGNDIILGGLGEDHILGGVGDDYIDGGDGADILEGNDGNDSIFGGAGGDIILGGAGDDYLSGGTEGDVIDGGSGTDRLTTGFGSDTLTGGSGVDRFTISKSASIEDTITDFQFGIGETIDLWAFSHIKQFTDLTLTQVGSDTIIELGNGQQLRVQNTSPGQFSASDFMFRNAAQEFVVNSDTSGYQGFPSISAMDNGNFVITWLSTTDTFSDTVDIRGRIFEADGTPQGSEFSIADNVGTTYYRNTEQKVIALSGGKFITVWDEYDTSASPSGYYIHGQIFNSSGQPVGSDIRLTDHLPTFTQQDQPDIIELSDGNLLISWIGQDEGEPGYDIRSQIIDANGNEIGSSFQLNTTTTIPSVEGYAFIALDTTALDNGRFVATWKGSYNYQDANDTIEYITYMQVMDSSGNKIGDEVVLLDSLQYRENGETVYENATSDLVVHRLANNNFIAVWQNFDYSGEFNDQLVGQIFNEDGGKIGNAFAIDTPDAHRDNPEVTALDDGGFVIAWSEYKEDLSGESTFAQRFRFDGVKIGEEYYVNDTTNGNRINPDVAQLESGDFVITWDGDPISSDSDVYGKIYATDDVVINKTIHSQVLSAEKEFTIQLPYDTFLDATGGELSYSASLANGLPLPEWLTFDPVNLTFTGLADLTDVGTIGVRVTATNSGSYISDSFNIKVTTPQDIYAAHPSSGEFRVNSTAANNQQDPVSAMLANGNYIVAWDGEISSGIRQAQAKIVDSNGNTVVSDFSFSHTGGGSASITVYSIAALSNGDFWIGWKEYDPSSLEQRLYVQRFNSSGSELGSEFLIQTPGDNQHDQIHIAETGSNKVTIGWSSLDNTLPPLSIEASSYKTVYNYSGSVVTGTSEIASSLNGTVGIKGIAHLDNDNTVIVFTRNAYYYDPNDSGEYYQIFNSSGNPVNSPVQFLPSDGAYGAIVAHPSTSGGFWIAWSGLASEDYFDREIYLQRFDASGNQLGQKIQVNIETNYLQYAPKIATLDNGHFVVIWNSQYQDDSGFGVYGQAFDENGNKLGEEFKVNDFIIGNQEEPTLVALPGNKFSVSWESVGQEGAESEIYTKIFTESDYHVIGQRAILTGSTDKDIINGTELNDTFTGGEGDDVFVIAKTAGNADVIRDFKVDSTPLTAVFDKIDLTAFTNIKSFADLEARITHNSPGYGGNIVIDLGDGQTLRLSAIDVTEMPLTADHFIFYRSFNNAPQIFTGVRDHSVLVDNTLDIVIPNDSFFDTDNDEISYTAQLADGSALPSWLTFDPLNKTFSGTPTNSEIGYLDIKLIASDGEKTNETFFKVNVNGTLLALNSGKTIGYVGTAPAEFEINDYNVASTSSNITLTLMLSDSAAGYLDAGGNVSTNGVLTLSGNIDDVNASLETLKFVKDVGFTGTVNISTLLIDGLNPDFTDNITIQTNAAPAAGTDVFAATEDGGSITIDTVQLIANDTDEEDIAPVFDSIVTGPSNGTLVLGAGSTYIYTPDPDFNGLDIFTYKVVDSFGYESTAEVRINVSATNDAPTLGNSIGTQPALAGNGFNFTFPLDSFEDIDGDTLTYAATLDDGITALPTWLHFDAVNRTFSGTPPSGAADSISVKVTASDAEYSVSQDFVIDIASNVINGTSGDDTTLNGTANNDEIYGLDGADTIRGNDGDDLIDGGAGNDFLFGGAGNDIIHGGDGYDVMDYRGQVSAVTIDASNGTTTDLVNGDIDNFDGIESYWGSHHNDVLIGSSLGESLSGAQGNDELHGGGGNDYLYGNEDDDLIYGDAGNDTIRGGAGSDTLTGGADSDTFIISVDAGSTDTITDFEIGVDKIDLSAYDSTFTNFIDLQTAASDDGSDTTIDFGNGHTLILSGVLVNQLSASDFIGNASLEENQAPTDITIDNSNVDENAAGSIIGNVSVTDPNAGDTHTITVDDNRFEVVGGQLKLKDGESLDFEAEPTVTINVTATDSGGLSYSEQFVVGVNDIEPEAIVPALSVLSSSSYNFTSSIHMEDLAQNRDLVESYTTSNGTAIEAEAASSQRLVMAEDGPASITFWNSRAWHENALGWYIVDEDGTISSPKLLFANAHDIGWREQIALGDLAAGTQIGFFILSDGAKKVWTGDGGGELGLAQVIALQQSGDLRMENAAGDTVSIYGSDAAQIAFEYNGEKYTSLAHTFLSESNGLTNSDGLVHATAGHAYWNGNLFIGFEDAAGGGDSDFNDLMFQLDLGDASESLDYAKAPGIGGVSLSHSEQIASAAVAISGGFLSGDQLVFEGYDVDASGNIGSTGLVAVYAGGILNISGISDAGTYESLLNAVRLVNTGSNADAGGSREILITVTDESGASSDIVTNVHVTNDPVAGSEGNDSMTGGASNDALFGRDGDDILDGAGGADILNGGAGADTLTGGLGADSFDFSALSDSTSAARDTITDFTRGEDIIDLSALLSEGVIDFSDLTISNDGVNTLVESADVANDFEIQLLGVHELDETDFNWG